MEGSNNKTGINRDLVSYFQENEGDEEDKEITYNIVEEENIILENQPTTNQNQKTKKQQDAGGKTAEEKGSEYVVPAPKNLSPLAPRRLQTE